MDQTKAIQNLEIIFLTIFSILFFVSCNFPNQSNFKKINSKNIQISYLYDEKGVVIDTFPLYLKIVQKYSFEKIDTSKVLLPYPKEAIEYAKNVLDTIYGKSKIDSEKPFDISLIDNKFWYITGTIPKKHQFGGAAEILISKYNGEVLYFIHGK